MGNFVHDILENLYRCEPSDRTLVTAKMIASDVWNEYEARVAGVLRGDLDAMRMFRWNSWWCVENLFAIEDPQQLEFDGLEYELGHTLFEETGTPVAIKGFIDRWSYEGDSIVIGDYKTGKVPGINYRQDKFYQLLVYGHVLKEILQKDISRIELLYIKNKEVLKHQPTEEDFALVAQDMIDTRKAIDERCQTGQFEHKRGRLCDWCAFKRDCPAWRKN